jgi:hypothetical protein
METFKNTERGAERHHAVCDHCGKTCYPSHKNINVFFGFLDSDTNMFVSNDCKKDYYSNKNKGKYGVQHINKYSEMPVMVPWAKNPYKKPIQLSLF